MVLPKGISCLPVLLLAAMCLSVSSSSSEILLPSEDVATLGPDDTLELVLKPTAISEGEVGAGVSLDAWVLPEGAELQAGAAPSGKAQVWPAPTRPGEWLVHLRGLKAPEKETTGRRWDLLLRWRFRGGATGEARLRGVLAFRSDKPDVVLLLDGSDSMGRNDPNRLRVDAARAFVVMALRSGGIGRISMIQFSSKVRTLLPLTSVQETKAFVRAFREINESGMTDIDGSLRAALEALTASSEQNPAAVVLLTDGKQEPGDYREAHRRLAAAEIPVHTVALGKSADRALLRRIAEDTGGTFSDAAKDQDLLRVYGAIASRIAGGRVIRSEPLPATGGEMEFPVDGSCRLLTVAASEPGTLELALPGDQALPGREEPHPVAYLATPPLGKWRATWRPAAGADKPQLDSLAHTALYPLFFRPRAGRGAPVEIDVDDPWIACSLAEGKLLCRNANAQATVVLGDGAPINVRLFDDGQHGDGAADDGIFAAALPDGTWEPGTTGTLRLVVSGERRIGEEYRRETRVPCVLKRGGMRRLYVSGPLDLGERWPGEDASAEMTVRVRGRGGKVSTRILPADGLAEGLLPECVLDGTPKELKPRQVERVRLRVRVPTGTPPGEYGGVVEFAVEGRAGSEPLRGRVPWRLDVRPVEVFVESTWLDMGTIAPGEKRATRMRVATRRGRTSVFVNVQLRPLVEPTFGAEGNVLLSSDTWPLNPIEVGPEGQEVSLEAAASAEAIAGSRVWLVSLRSAEEWKGLPRPRDLSVFVHAHVSAQWLRLEGALAFGELEVGDSRATRVTCTLMDGERERRVPARFRVINPDRTVRTDWVNEAPGNGVLSVHAQRHAAEGTLSGWLEVEYGPALLRRSWAVDVIVPSLTIAPGELDLGTCLPGRTLKGRFAVELHGARPSSVEASLEDPPRKPAVPHVWMPNRVVRLPVDRLEIEPGDEVDLPVEVDVPDGAQDGEYRLRLRLVSRLGRQVVTARFRVGSPVPLPLFHIAPTEVTLKVARDGSPFPVDLTIESHVDRELEVTAGIRPSDAESEGCAELVPGDSGPASEVTFVLPPRAVLGLQVQGASSSRQGDTCGIRFTSEDEFQVVRATIERERVPETAVLTKEARSRFDWLRLLLLLLLLLLVILILSLTKRKWVRYSTYAVVSHAVLMLIAVPPSTFVNALPPSVQLTIMGQPPDELVETTPEQARRIRDLPSVVAMKEKQHPQDVDALSAPKAPELGNGPEASVPDAPTTPVELSQASAPIAERQTELQETERVQAQASNDAALSFDAPSEPSPEPVRPRMVKARAPAQASMTAAPAPLSALRPDLPQTTLAPEITPALQQASVQVRRQEVPLTTSPAHTRVAAATTDLPLSVEPIPSPKSDLAAAPPQKGILDVRATPAGVSSSSLDAQPIAFRAPASGAAEVPKPYATENGTLSPETGAAWRIHGTGSGAALTGTFERGAGKPGPGQGDVPFDLGQGQGFAQGGQGFGSGPDAPAGRLRPAGSGSPTATGTGAGGGPPRLGGGTGSARTASIGGAGGNGATVSRLTGGTGTTGGTTSGGVRGSQRQGGVGGTGDAPLDFGGPGTGTAKRNGGPGQGGQGTVPTGPKVPAGGGGLATFGGGSGGVVLGCIGTGKGRALVKPGGGGRSDMGAPLDTLSLERFARGGQGKVASSRGLPGIRPLWGAADSTTLHVRLGLARHGGDWDSSPTALFHLASAFRERSGLPALEVEVVKVSLSDAVSMSACALVMVTSNDPIPWKPTELAAMRAYAGGGGLLWVNDSSATGDERFDAAFRGVLPRIFPGRQLRKLDWNHPLFAAAYDLTRGFKGYPLPPGDKYREEFARGVQMGPGAQARLGLLYTRNDYADGLEIDPRSIAGMKSLTDLAPHEMLEGALRFGMNTLAYALGSSAPRMPPPPESAAEMAKLYRYHGAPLAVFDEFDRNVNEAGEPVWAIEEWGNPGEVAIERNVGGHELRVRMKSGDKAKVVLSRLVELDLSGAKAVVFDLHSGFQEGFNAALLFQTKPDWNGYETRPVYIRPGWNRNLRFPLTLDDFKSSKTGWKEYNTPFQPRTDVGRLCVLLYNLHVNGDVRIDKLRIER